MNSLEESLLGSLVENHDNRRVPLSSSERKNLEKKYPYYGAQGVIDYVDNYLFDGEFILVAEDGENLRSQKKSICQVVTGKFWVNNHAHIIRAAGENNTRYLAYVLNLIDFGPYVTGSAQPKLTKENLSLIKLRIHKPAAQRKIARLLTTLDDKIALNHRINAELEAMAKLLYDYWFVQFDFPISAAQAAALGKPGLEGQPYRSSGGKMTHHPDLKREIPAGWKVRSLFDAMDVQYGFPFSTAQFTSVETPVPVVRIRDILENSISNYTTEQVDLKYRLEKADLVIGMDGNFHMNFWDKDGSYLNQRCVRVRAKARSPISIFQASFELSPFIKAREKNVSRTTVGHLSDKDLKRLSLLEPETGDGFNPREIFDSLLAKILLNRSENQELAALRDWLLPMLMNGQVTVSES